MIKVFKATICFCFVWSLTLLIGCQESALRFSVKYENLDGLKAKAPVYFQDIQVGHVEQIVSTEQGAFLVKVALNPEHKARARVNSKFYILNDPHQARSKALVIEQDAPDGLALKNGAIVQGSKKSFFAAIFSELKATAQSSMEHFESAMQRMKDSLSEQSVALSHEMETTVNDLGSSLQDLADELKAVPESDKFKEMEKALDRFMVELMQSSTQVQEEIREEFLPQLRQEMEALRDWLEEEDRTEDAEKIEFQIEKISKV